MEGFMPIQLVETEGYEDGSTEIVRAYSLFLSGASVEDYNYIIDQAEVLNTSLVFGNIT